MYYVYCTHKSQCILYNFYTVLECTMYYVYCTHKSQCILYNFYTVLECTMYYVYIVLQDADKELLKTKRQAERQLELIKAASSHIASTQLKIRTELSSKLS